MPVKWYSNKSRDFYINIQNIKTATIDEFNPFYLKIYDLSDKVENLIKTAIFNILKHLDRLYLKDSIYTIIKEAAINGVKANIKRAVFFNMGLDIGDAEDYEKGIKLFKEKMLSEMNYYFERNKKENRYVMIKIEFDKDCLTISIKNNVPIQKKEMKRINERIEKSKTLESMAELFTIGLDEEEGAGLGIAMIVLLLKNENFGIDNFKIYTNEKDTIVTVNIPLEIKEEQEGYKISQKMIEEIEELPAFDKNLQHIQELIKDPNTYIEDIAEAIKRDIALTSYILKLVNSTAFALPNKIDNISKAIKIIGLSELGKMLYTIGSKEIMEKRYEAFEEIWEMSGKTAFICKKLSQKLGHDRKIQNTLSIAGLLHDIGRVILISLEKDTVKSIMKVAGLRHESTDTILEEAFMGINHTTIGVILAKKWNFPETIQKAIEFHHNPYLVDKKEDKEIVYTVYLADKIIEINEGQIRYEKIYDEALEYFNFDKESFINFSEQVLQEYNNFKFNTQNN